MFKKFFPDMVAANVYEIDYQALHDKGFGFIIFDIDNTLTSQAMSEAGYKLIRFADGIKKIGFKVCLVSNNYKNRVEVFAQSMKLPCVHYSLKPMKRGFKKALKILGASAHNTVVIGDQLFTDIWGANRLGIFSILVNPLEDRIDSFTVFKRKMELKILELLKGKR